VDKISINFKSKENKLNFYFDEIKKSNFISIINKSNFRNCVIFIDNRVFKIFKKKITIIKKKKFVKKFVANENLKNIKNVLDIVEFFEKNKINKSDLVLVIGGGTVSDLIGFCCSIYMRGLTFWSIPTTLMAQVDALSAGKTCINTKNSKNTVGSFYYSEKIFLIPELIRKDSLLNYRQGLSEILKYGLLGNKHIISILDKHCEKNKILALTYQNLIIFSLYKSF
jgi:3-dehydroquinate synthase